MCDSVSGAVVFSFALSLSLLWESAQAPFYSFPAVWTKHTEVGQVPAQPHVDYASL